jgi:hypothetical protein
MKSLVELSLLTKNDNDSRIEKNRELQQMGQNVKRLGRSLTIGPRDLFSVGLISFLGRFAQEPSRRRDLSADC